MATITNQRFEAYRVAEECKGNAALLAGRVRHILPDSYGVEVDVYRFDDGSAIVHSEDERGYEYACVCEDHANEDVLHAAMLDAFEFAFNDDDKAGHHIFGVIDKTWTKERAANYPAIPYKEIVYP